MNKFVDAFTSGLIELVRDNWFYILGFVFVVLIVASVKGKLTRR